MILGVEDLATKAFILKAKDTFEDMAKCVIRTTNPKKYTMLKYEEILEKMGKYIESYVDYKKTGDIIDSQTRSTQAVLDKLCQLELDGVKAQVEAKNDRIADLQRQLSEANRSASQTAQNAFIQQGFSNEVDQLYNRLNSCPVPTTPVYGRTPIFTCNQNTCGCGCGMA